MSVIQKPFLFLIRCYQWTLSPDHGVFRAMIPPTMRCRMYPTCSTYTYDAIRLYGVFHGISKGFFRILRCNPYQKQHIDYP